MYSPSNASRAVHESVGNRLARDTRLDTLCASCVEGCTNLCEAKYSAIRGPEALYPAPFGKLTAGAERTFPIDWSHFLIQGTCQGAYGIEPDSDEALFTNVNVETILGKRDGKEGIKLGLPTTIPGLGSTDVAKNNWEALAMGAALYGLLATVGENVVGMDMHARFDSNGKVIDSPDLRKRIESYRKWKRNGYGEIAVQANVEDTRLGVLEYAIKELGVKVVEIKWGQGAKNIGGEVKIDNLEKAQELKKRGYVVLPDPLNEKVIEAFKQKRFREFERHSRVGMVTEEGFAQRVEELRDAGAEYIFLKTGPYIFEDQKNALVWGSKYSIDVITIDATGGGTGMSPWRMMLEWGIPPVELFDFYFKAARKLEEKGERVPDIVFAGGFAFEDHIFKGLASGAPYIKAIGMASAPLLAVMQTKNIPELIRTGNLPRNLERFGETMEEILIASQKVKELIGKNKFEKMAGGGNDHEASVLAGALGVVGIYERLSQGLRQFMTGARKFSLEYLSRDDLRALTEEAAEYTGIKSLKEDSEDVLDSI